MIRKRNIMKQAIYLDNAATTPLRNEVVQRMQQVLANTFGNPSSTHSFGREAKAVLELSRKTIAQLLGVTGSEIIFTSGGSEADNLILISSVRDLGVKTIITSPIEHHAVLHTIAYLQNQFGTDVQYVKVLENGTIDYTHLESLLKNSDQKTLVSLMHVNNEVGNLLDIKKTGELCKQYQALFHSDTVQSIGHYNIDFSKLGVDFAAASAHKFHGPKGVGFALIKKPHVLKPLLHGGAQEKGLRAGTEAVYAIAGLAEALTHSLKNLEAEKAHISKLKKHFINTLKAAIPAVVFNGNSENLEKSSYTILNITLPLLQEKAQLLNFELDIKGIACSKGSACQSGSNTGSHVLQQIQDQELQKYTSLRFSFSSINTLEEIDYTVSVLKQFVLSKK